MSDVARLRQQIDQEIEAMNQLLQGPAIVANHAAIHRHMQALWDCKQQLHAHVPADEATVMLIAALNQVERHPHDAEEGGEGHEPQ